MTAAALAHAEKYPPFTDKYAVERILGRGGMGTVFAARHVRLGHEVAIKVLGEELRAHPDLVKRFEREARAASALSSPHAVRVFDIDQTADGTPFFVMELLEGRDLAALVEAEGPQPYARAVRWVVEACDAIAEAHRLGIVHRDLKPSNLLLCESGIIKVLDFGIAKQLLPSKQDAALTAGLVPLGTPAYMSPEQVRCAKDVDARTDIWSLGVTLYELLTGRTPFEHDVAQACIAAIVADPVPDPRAFAAMPAGLAAVVQQALAKDPGDRFASVHELVLALAPYVDAPAARDELPSLRVITGARRAVADSSPTLGEGEGDGDGEEPVLALRSVSGVEPKELAAPPEEPAPPVVADEPSVVRVRPRVERAAAAAERRPAAGAASEGGRRVRSLVALGAAAAFGLVALLVTPRLGCPASSPTAAPTASAAALETATTHAAILPVATAAAASLDAPAVSPEPTGSLDPEPGPPAPPSAAPSPAVAPPAAAVAPSAGARGARQAPRVRYVGSERPVHGGITGPGF